MESDTGMWQTVIILGCAFLLMLTVILLHWIDRKTDKGDKKKQRDPLMSAVMLTAFLMAIFLIGEGIGAMPQGWMEEHLNYFVVLFVVALIYYAVQQRQKSRKSFKRQYNAAKEVLGPDVDLYTQDYKGEGMFFPFDHYKVKERISAEGKVVGSSGIFKMKRQMFNLPIDFLVEVDSFTLEVNEILISPRDDEKDKKMEEEPVMHVGTLESEQ